MTVDRFEGQLPEILVELALPRTPDYIDDILSQTARTRQRPGWTFPERWLPMDIAANVPAGGRQIPWRSLGILALVAVLLAIAIVAGGSRQDRPLPTPYGPAANGSLVYDRDGDIYVADAGLSKERLVIGGLSNDYAVTWSRDGSRIFFARDVAGGVAVMTADSDGGDVRQASATLLNAPEEHDFSPTSGELAVIDTVAGRPALRILDLSGDGGVRTLDLATGVDRRMQFDPSAHCELMPVFSPDGKTIVAERQTEDGIAHIFVAPVDGGGPGVSVGPTYDYRSRSGYALSPDGTKVIWVPNEGMGRLITLATGAVEDSSVQFPGGFPSWQRLAP